MANGALSGGGDEHKIRKQLVENNLVETVCVLPQNMFYTTGISVSLWILNNNKKERVVKHPDETRNYRNREDEILFLDLRALGEPFEKKYIQFNQEKHIAKIAATYHDWQQNKNFEDIPEYCYGATKKEVAAKDYSLVPSKYIEFVNRDENIDFDTKMTALQTEFADLLKAEEKSKADLLNVFKELGYEVKL